MIDVNRLFAFAKSVEGEDLPTLHRKNSRFRVAVLGAGLEFTPGKSRTPRVGGRHLIESVLFEANNVDSIYPKDYQSPSRNLSYILALR